MSLRRTLFTSITLAALALPQVASAYVDVDINLGTRPPAPRYERVPVAPPGYTWAPGFWAWDGRHYIWQDGYWVNERPGYIWVQDVWVQRGRSWHYAPGHWEDDRRTERPIIEHEGPRHRRHY